MLSTTTGASAGLALGAFVAATLATASADAAVVEGAAEAGTMLASRSFRYTDAERETELWSLSVPSAFGVRSALEFRTTSSLPALLASWSLRATLEAIPFVDVESSGETTTLEALRARVLLGRRWELSPGLVLALSGGYHAHTTRSGLTGLLPSLRAEALEGGLEVRGHFSALSVALGAAYRFGLGVGELGAPSWFESARFIGVRSFAEVALVAAPRWMVVVGLDFDQSGFDFNPLSPSLPPSRRAGGATDRELSAHVGLRFSWEGASAETSR